MYNVNEPDTFVAAQSNFEDRICAIPRVFEPSDQLTGLKKNCETHVKRYKT